MAPVQTAKADAPTIPVTIKNPLVENFADQQYQRALILSEKNKDVEAITVLKGVLLAFPEHMQAREMLITLLVKQGNVVDADKLLVVGLQQQPANLRLIELKARLLVQENKVTEAIGLLENSAPPLVENPEYHAFIAALYERQGQSVLSANLYKQLVTLQPGNAKWWLGLGVALESVGNHGQALEAYANADGAGGLNPELKAYVETQLRG